MHKKSQSLCLISLDRHIQENTVWIVKQHVKLPNNIILLLINICLLYLKRKQIHNVWTHRNVQLLKFIVVAQWSQKRRFLRDDLENTFLKFKLYSSKWCFCTYLLSSSLQNNIVINDTYVSKVHVSKVEFKNI